MHNKFMLLNNVSPHCAIIDFYLVVLEYVELKLRRNVNIVQATVKCATLVYTM